MNTNSKWNALKEAPWLLHGEGGCINKKKPGTGRAFFRKLGV
jgi:hypothetical protein